MTTRLKTRLFEIKPLPIQELADILGLSPSYVYRIKLGQRGIGGKFIVAVLQAFPGKFEDMFYLSDSK